MFIVDCLDLVVEESEYDIVLGEDIFVYYYGWIIDSMWWFFEE